MCLLPSFAVTGCHSQRLLLWQLKIPHFPSGAYIAGILTYSGTLTCSYLELGLCGVVTGTYIGPEDNIGSSLVGYMVPVGLHGHSTALWVWHVGRCLPDEREEDSYCTYTLLCVFETASDYVAQTRLKLVILLPLLQVLRLQEWATSPGSHFMVCKIHTLLKHRGLLSS
jgi:hypothetical protein